MGRDARITRHRVNPQRRRRHQHPGGRSGARHRSTRHPTKSRTTPPHANPNLTHCTLAALLDARCRDLDYPASAPLLLVRSFPTAPHSSLPPHHPAPHSPFFLFLTLPDPTSSFFFFNDPPPPEIYPLPLHAALPI